MFWYVFTVRVPALRLRCIPGVKEGCQCRNRSSSPSQSYNLSLNLKLQALHPAAHGGLCVDHATAEENKLPPPRLLLHLHHHRRQCPQVFQYLCTILVVALGQLGIVSPA